MDRFRWHAEARLWGESGEAQGPVEPEGSVIAPRPGALALARALAAEGPFRIGGEGPLAAPLPEPSFETLTSGSSGTPRRILRTQASWIASFQVNARLFGIGPGLRVAVLGRMESSLSLYGGLEALNLGADLHVLEALRPDRQVQALAARRVALIYATPAQLRLLVEAGGPGLPDLRTILLGGSKLDAGLRAALGRLAPGATIREFYGAAETSFITLADGQSPPDSVGGAYPGVEIEIRREGRALAEGEQGEIWVRSPYLFRAYAGGDPGSARWSEGWLSVGEIGHFTGGNLFLAGRAGRMVTVADQNVFPEEIEGFLASLPGIVRVAVLPRTDALRGNVLIAVAQGDPAAEPAILAAARAKLGPLKAPRAMIWRQDWPVLASGKTDLATLMREHAR